MIVVRSPYGKSALTPVSDAIASLVIPRPVLHVSRPQVMDRILVMGTPAAGASVPTALAGEIMPVRSPALEAPDVDVDVLNIQNGGINVARANRVDVRQGGISRVEAQDVAVNMGGIAIARADRVSAEMSAVAIALAGEARVSQSFVRALFTRDARLEQTAVWSLLANRVTFQRSSFAGVVIARRVEGNVKTLVDWKGALAVASVVGAVSAVMAVVRRR